MAEFYFPATQAVDARGKLIYIIFNEKLKKLTCITPFPFSFRYELISQFTFLATTNIDLETYLPFFGRIFALTKKTEK